MGGPMIVPDAKDWTWVLERRCDDCGFDATAFAVTETGARTRANAARRSQVGSGDETQTSREACRRRDATQG